LAAFAWPGCFSFAADSGSAGYHWFVSSVRWRSPMANAAYLDPFMDSSCHWIHCFAATSWSLCQLSQSIIAVIDLANCIKLDVIAWVVVVVGSIFQ